MQKIKASRPGWCRSCSGNEMALIFNKSETECDVTTTVKEGNC
jgi:hypothetical protein